MSFYCLLLCSQTQRGEVATTAQNTDRGQLFCCSQKFSLGKIYGNFIPQDVFIVWFQFLCVTMVRLSNAY